MKVIFLEDLPKVAFAGEVKEVADGYARNYLIPKKIAVIAKPDTVNIVAARQTKRAGELNELADKLEGVEVNLKARAGSKDRLYGSVTTADIAAELNRITGLEVDKRKIDLDKPIHQLGSYELAIRLAKDIAPKIKVNVSGEGDEQGKPVAEEEKEPPKAETSEEPSDTPQSATEEEEKELPKAEAAEELSDAPQPATEEEESAQPDDTKSE